MGFSAVAMGGPDALLAVGDDLTLERRPLALGAAQRLLDLLALLGALLVLVLVGLGLAGQRVLELAHSGSQRAPETGQALGPEDDEHDQEDDRELWDPDAFEHAFGSLFPDYKPRLSVQAVKSDSGQPILG